MKCSPLIMNLTGYLHIFSLAFAVFGTSMQIDALQKDKPNSIWLSLTLCIMLLLRIPNQVCLSLIHGHGWYNVIGTLMGSLSFAYLTQYLH